ncbi:hydrogenase maturation protease [Nocardioides pacificus]
MTESARGALVIGLGTPDAGDDAVGGVVAREVATRLPAVTVVDHEDPTTLLDLWAGHSPVVVVDAVRSGAPAGTVHWLATGAAGPPLGAGAWRSSGRRSTHAVGLAEMVELGRALGRLPESLVVVGVEAGGLDHGESLTPSVSAVVPVAAERVCAVVGATVGPAAGPAAGAAGGEDGSDVSR